MHTQLQILRASECGVFRITPGWILFRATGVFHLYTKHFRTYKITVVPIYAVECKFASTQNAHYVDFITTWTNVYGDVHILRAIDIVAFHDDVWASAERYQQHDITWLDIGEKTGAVTRSLKFVRPMRHRSRIPFVFNEVRRTALIYDGYIISRKSRNSEVYTRETYRYTTSADSRAK